MRFGRIRKNWFRNSPIIATLVVSSITLALPAPFSTPAAALALPVSTTSAVIDQLGGLSRALTIDSDGIAYLAVGPRVVALDVEADKIVELGRSPVLPGIVVGLAVADGLAFVAAEDNGGLRVFDVSDPTAIVEVGALDDIGNARGVDVSGGFAYVAVADAGLVVVDVTTPAEPRLVGSTGPMPWAARVQAHGSIAIVTNSETERFPSSCSGRQVWRSGDSSVWLVDVSDPAHMYTHTKIAQPGTSSASVAVGDRLYVVTATSIVPVGEPEEDWLTTYDISEPDRPREITATASVWSECLDLVAVDGGGLVASCGRLWSFDLSDPDRPVAAGSPASGAGIAIDVSAGGRIIVANELGGAHAVDFESPSGPVIVARYRPLGASRSLAVSDSAIAVQEAGCGEIVSLERSPEGSVHGARIDVEGQVSDQGFLHDHLVVAAQTDEEAWLDTYDLSDPTLPRGGATFGTGLWESSLAIDGDRAIVLGLRPIDTPDFGGAFGFQLADIDLVDPSRPALRAFADVEGCGTHVVSGRSMFRSFVSAVGGQVYPAIDECGIPVLDWSASIRPELLGEVDLWGQSLLSITLIEEDTAFIATGAGLAVIDISDPAHPELRTTVEAPFGRARDGHVLARIDDRMYVADGVGIVVLDAADRHRPVVLGRLQTPGRRAVALASDGTALFAADLRAGLVELDPRAELEPVRPMEPPAPSAEPLPTATAVAPGLPADGAIFLPLVFDRG